MSYEPEPAFGGLFRVFTGHEGSIGGALTDAMVERSADDPMIVSTASDIAIFPGAGRPPMFESFRKSTRGFIELTAISHLPLAIAYVAQLREIGVAEAAWQTRLQGLVEHALRARAVNNEAMWRDHVALRAFAGSEAKIARMVEHAIKVSVAYAQSAIEDPSRLDAERLRHDFLERREGPRAASMNDIMFATFCLAYIDIAWRIGGWLRRQALDWQKAMVLVSGQSGRPTAGVTWASNNICHLIWQASGERLPVERLYVAPHAAGFSVAGLPDPDGLVALERQYRRLWCHTRASVEVSGRIFPADHARNFVPARPSDMPPIESPNDRDACVARLRRIMDDPSQLLSNCVADYVVDRLRDAGDRPEAVPVPGFTNSDFP